MFRTDERTVPVYVTVSDEAGNLVPDLTAEDFEIYDNGKRQKITSSRAGPADHRRPDAGSKRQHAEQLPAASRTPKSSCRPASADKERIEASRIVFSSIPAISQQPARPDRDPEDGVAGAGSDAVVDAVNVAITALQHQAGRRVVLVFTDGVDRPMNSRSISLNEVMRNAEAHDVMVFAVGLAGRSTLPGRGRRGGSSPRGPGQQPEFEKPAAGLPRVALATGGG